MAENCAESATTATPHTTPTPSTSHRDLPKVSPIASAQEPEMAMARAVVRVRPQRSPRTPPRQQPTAPAPITSKVPSPAEVLVGPGGSAARRLSPRNTANHDHIAYSSH